MLGETYEDEWRTHSKTFIADAYDTDIRLPGAFYSIRQGKMTEVIGPQELQDIALVCSFSIAVLIGGLCYFIVVKGLSRTGLVQSFVRDFFKHFDIYRVGHSAAAAKDEKKWKKKEKKQLSKWHSAKDAADVSDSDSDDDDDDGDKSAEGAAEMLLLTVFEEDEGDGSRQFASFLGGIASICFFITFAALAIVQIYLFRYSLLIAYYTLYSVQIYLFRNYNVEYAQSLFPRGPIDSTAAFRSDFTVKLYFVGYTGEKRALCTVACIHTMHRGMHTHYAPWHAYTVCTVACIHTAPWHAYTLHHGMHIHYAP
jgi:hypothetical protein